MEEDFELSLFKLQNLVVQIGLTILLSEPTFYGCKAESLEHFQKLDLLDCVVGRYPACSISVQFNEISNPVVS